MVGPCSSIFRSLVTPLIQISSNHQQTKQQLHQRSQQPDGSKPDSAPPHTAALAETRTSPKHCSLLPNHSSSSRVFEIGVFFAEIQVSRSLDNDSGYVKSQKNLDSPETQNATNYHLSTAETIKAAESFHVLILWLKSANIKSPAESTAQLKGRLR